MTVRRRRTLSSDSLSAMPVLVTDPSVVITPHVHTWLYTVLFYTEGVMDGVKVGMKDYFKIFKNESGLPSARLVLLAPFF
jgi:hypothetical protein